MREVDQSLPAALPDVEGVEDLDHAVALLQSSGKVRGAAGLIRTGCHDLIFAVKSTAMITYMRTSISG